MEDSRRRGRRIFLILAAMFLLPVATAFTLYYGKLWRPAQSSSKGVLIEPARPLAVAGLRNPDGSPGAPLTGKWSIVYVGDGACDADCRAALLFARQTRLALNNEMSRVQNVLLAPAGCCAPELAKVVPGIVALDASAPEAVPLLAQFPADGRAHSLFIVDPLGNLMMRHDARVTSRDLLADLKKLLKLSHIG